MHCIRIKLKSSLVEDRNLPNMLLTHWHRDKMAAICQTFLNTFSWMKMFELRLKFTKCPFNNVTALVQIMAWRLSGDKPLSEPMIIYSLMHIRVGRPQRVNNIPALVQTMAWRRPCDKPLSEPMMFRLPMHICITQPQWVKTMAVDDLVTQGAVA